MSLETNRSLCQNIQCLIEMAVIRLCKIIISPFTCTVHSNAANKWDAHAMVKSTRSTLPHAGARHRCVRLCVVGYRWRIGHTFGLTTRDLKRELLRSRSTMCR